MEKDIQTIVLGGGCFWCVEAVFQKIEGVISVIPGYSGGSVEDPSYEDVCSGNTGHAEVVELQFNSKKISLEKILKVFFLAHDPTTLNRQGSDIGTQYRSIILYSDMNQKEIINDVIGKLQGEYKESIVTEVKALGNFYKAEGYHKDYYLNNQNLGYCRLVIQPKIDKVISNI